MKRIIRFVRKDSFHPAPLNFSMLGRGFFSHRAALYPFDQYDHRWFLTDWAVHNHCERLNPPWVVSQMTDKLYFHLLLRHFGLGEKLAPLIGTSVDGVFTSFSAHATLAEAIERLGPVMIKPTKGSGGMGIRRIDQPDQLPRSGAFLIEATLKQHAYADTLFPGAVNTIRVMTLRPRATEAPVILGTAHRFGVAASAPVDNFSSGGIIAGIDFETGALTPARSAVGQYSKVLHTHHPDTGAPFIGTHIPMWDQVKELALEMAALIPGLKIAGWDICVTPEGPRLIEGNGSLPHPELIQAHVPVLLNPRARHFYAEHGVISPRLAECLSRLAAEQTSLEPSACLAK